MTPIRHRLLGLCLPPAIFCLADGAITLAGQSEAYWSGQYHLVNEGSPTFNQLLQIHPLAFVAGILGWAMVFSGIILLLPETLALIVSIAVTFGHTLGTATWILYRFQYGYQACNGLLLSSAIILGLGIRWGWKAQPPAGYRYFGLGLITRTVLCLLLFGVGVYLYLWPRSI